uniref:outer membrane beta-barrel protein n=1 Tax=uncultured Draconibacterium sp. TaxID=1573823 RepID=UPI00321805D0
MTLRKISLVFLVVFIVMVPAKSQIVGFRIAANSNMFITELGTSDVPHPDVFVATPPFSTEKYSPQPTVGVEGELLFQVSPMSHFGVELEYSKLKGYNDDPPAYNYYLTPYYTDNFQASGELVTDPVAFNTTLFNVAVNWKYFFFESSPLKPFVKLTGVVAFVGTDFTIKENEKVLYARGTLHSTQEKWPAFHLGGGFGFDYKLSNQWSVQVDGTATVINSGIINGVPNFTYEKVGETEYLRYNNRSSLTMQLSAGLVYYIEVGDSKRGSQGRTDPNLPFYRKKN